MLYQNYELKMQRLANVKKNLLKFKIPFVILLSLIGLAITVLLSVSGMIVTDLDSVSDITYGQSLSLQAEVLFGDADFEFRRIDTRSSEWTKEEPILPGTYEVRVTSSRTFGTSVGDSVEFTIFPKEVTVKAKESTIVFGDKFNFTSDLESGDYFVTGEVDYYNFYSLETQKVSPIIESLVVYNRDGIDVSSAYLFTSIESSITLTRRNVNFTAASLSKEYSKTALTSNDYTVTNLVEGHTYDFDINGSIINVGTAANVISNISIYNNLEDISHMYNITSTNGTLSITAKDLFVTTSSASKVYDGTTLTNNNFEVNGLITGDEVQFVSNVSITEVNQIENKLVVTTNSNNYKIIYNYGTLSITPKDITITTNTSSSVYTGFDYSDIGFTNTELMRDDKVVITSNSSIKLVGEVSNNLVVAIYNGSNDITNCYNITYNYGKLTVTKRDLNVTSLSNTKVYDGTILEQIDYLVTNLSSVDKTNLLTNTKIINVGTEENEISISIFQGTIDVSNCYSINYTFGQLEITYRYIKVQTATNTKEYDGTALTDNTWVYTSIIELASNHILSINTDASITNVGTIDNTYISYTILGNGIDVSSNYNVVITEGELSITRRAVTILTGSASKVYDDTALTENTYTYTSSNLVNNHTLNIDINGSIINVGVEDNTYNTLSVYDGLNDVSYNYDITVNYGKLTITVRNINVVTNDATKVYDATPLTNETYYVSTSQYDLVTNHNFVIIFSGSQTNVGTSYNTISSCIILKDNSTDVTSNYNITITTGELEVTHREISVVTDSDEKVYDGTALTKHSWSYVGETLLVEGQILLITYTGSQTNVGVSNNTYSAYAIFDDSFDVSNNYIVNITTGELEVTALAIEVITNSNTYVYNGYAQHDSVYVVNTLADNHESSIDEITGEKEVTNDGENKYTIIIKNNGVDVTSNYDINYTYGKLVIVKREVNILTDSDEKVYDDTELIKHSYSYNETENEFVSTHSFSININGTITEVLSNSEVGIVDNTYSSYSIVDEYGFDVSSNYNIVIELGTLTIKHRNVSIITASGNKVFDDEPLYVSGYEYNNTILELVLGHELTIDAQASVVLVEDGVVLNQYNDNYFVLNGSVDVTKNYIFEIDLGEIYITPRTVNITTASITSVYNGTEIFIHEYDYTIGNEYDIISSHTFDVDYLNSLINVGEINNEISYHIYRSVDKFNLGNNYIFDVTEGTIKVEQRTVNIYTATDSKIYDGDELSNSNWYYSLDNEYEFVDEVKIIINSYIINFGSIENEVSKVEFTNDVFDNYDINIVNGFLSISKRSINIESLDDKKVYDGTILFNYDIKVEELNGDRGLASTDNFSIDSYETITYYINGGKENIVIVIISNPLIQYGEFNPNDNYDINYTYGTLSILKRDLSIETESANEVYSGTYVSNNEYYYDHNELASTDQLVLIDNTKLYLVDDSGMKNILTFAIYHIGLETDLSYNYNINYDYGILEMSAYSINIKTSSKSQIYDGTDLRSTLFVTLDDEELFLLGDDLFVYESSTTVRYVSSPVSNVIIYTISNGSIDVSCNYDVTVDYGTLVVYERVIEVTTEDQSFEYTGEDHYWPYYSVTGQYDFISTDGVIESFNSYVTTFDDGIVDNTFEWDLANKDAISSYRVEVTPGKLQIIVIDITITTDSAMKDYDGDPLVALNKENVVGLLDGHTIEFDIIGSQTEVGESPNYIDMDSIVILNSNNEDVTSSFNVLPILGTLIVITKDIEIATAGGEFEYDGNDLTDGWVIVRKDDYVLFQDSNALYYEVVLNENDTLYIEITGFISATDINNTVKNTFEFYVLNKDNEDVTSNYFISKFEGDMTLVPRSITVTSETKEFEYDGKLHSWEYASITEGTLVSGDRLETNSYSSIQNVGVVENKFTAYIFNGINDYSAFYNVTYDNGNLIMSPGKITITTGSNLDNPFVYNGEGQSYLEFEVSSEVGIDLSALFEFTVNEETATQVTYVTGSNYVKNILDIIIMSSGVDFTDSFEIEYVYGDLKLIPVEVVVSAENNHVIYEYDATFQTIKEANVIIYMPFYDSYKITDSFTVINGTTLYAPGSTNLIFEITFGSLDENYIISYSLDDAKLEIIKRVLVIQTIDYVSEFNNEYQWSNSFYLTTGEFAANHLDLFVVGSTIKLKDINYNENGFIGNSSNYLINFEDLSIIGIEDIYAYYDITVIAKGYLVITAISFDIETTTFTKIYDGNYLFGDNATFVNSYYISGNIISGHEIILTMPNNFVDVNKMDNSYDTLTIIDHNGEFTTEELFEIYSLRSEVIGYLEIYQKDLYVTAYSFTRPYAQTDNYILEHEDYKGYTIKSFEGTNYLIIGHSIVLGAVEICVNGEGTIELFNYYITDSNGRDVTNNYNISSDPKSVVYTQIGLIIESNSATKVHDGTALYDWDYSITDGYLIEGHILEVEINSTRTNVGTTVNAIKGYKIYKEENGELIELTDEEIECYYSITTINGLLIVT